MSDQVSEVKKDDSPSLGGQPDSTGFEPSLGGDIGKEKINKHIQEEMDKIPQLISGIRNIVSDQGNLDQENGDYRLELNEAQLKSFTTNLDSSLIFPDGRVTGVRIIAMDPNLEPIDGGRIVSIYLDWTVDSIPPEAYIKQDLRAEERFKQHPVTSILAYSSATTSYNSLQNQFTRGADTRVVISEYLRSMGNTNADLNGFYFKVDGGYVEKLPDTILGRKADFKQLVENNMKLSTKPNVVVSKTLQSLLKVLRSNMA